MSETIKNDLNRKANPGPTAPPNLTSITVLAAPRVLNFIGQETLRYDDQGLETGGILVGSWLDEDTVYLVGATGSGPLAEHAQYSFAVDTDYANAELSRLRQSFPGSDYVGEWHKHPATLEKPSQGDLMTGQQLLADPDYPDRLINPIITVLNHQALFHFFYLDRNLPDFVGLKEHGLLEANSPNEPWENGSVIYHANIVLLPKTPPAPPANQAVNPPVNGNLAAELPNPFTGSASEVDSQTLKKFATYFDPVPPARLASHVTDNPANPLFDPVPPASLSPEFTGYPANPAEGQPQAEPARPSATLLILFGGLILLLVVLLILFLLTR
jgi:hypothetical protein